MLHFHSDGFRDKNTAVDLRENVSVPEQDEVVERTGVGNDDHAGGYGRFVVSKRSSVVMSLSKSSTV